MRNEEFKNLLSNIINLNYQLDLNYQSSFITGNLR